MKTAFITGISGMDGSHLADLLLTKGYKVYGMERRSSAINNINTKHLDNTITILNGDMTDQNSLLRCLNLIRRKEKTNWYATAISNSKDYPDPSRIEERPINN